MTTTRDAIYTHFPLLSSPGRYAYPMVQAVSEAATSLTARLFLARGHQQGVLGRRLFDEEFGNQVARAEGRGRRYSQQTVGRWMKGGIDQVSVLNAFADVCGVSRVWLTYATGGMLDGAGDPLPVVWAREEADAATVKATVKATPEAPPARKRPALGKSLRPGSKASVRKRSNGGRSA